MFNEFLYIDQSQFVLFLIIVSPNAWRKKTFAHKPFFLYYQLVALT